MRALYERVELRTVSIVVPITAGEQEVIMAATAVLRDVCHIPHFEIVLVTPEEPDDAAAETKRYLVGYMPTRGEVVYVHPEFAKAFRAAGPLPARREGRELRGGDDAPPDPSDRVTRRLDWKRRE